METPVFINKIGSAVPHRQIHGEFLEHLDYFFDSKIARTLRMIERHAGIEKRYSVFNTPLKANTRSPAFYKPSEHPHTGQRMQVYQQKALPLAMQAVSMLFEKGRHSVMTHIIVVSRTGFYSPGLDFELVQALELPQETERSILGFMGCYSTVCGLRQARHIVRSQPQAQVLLVNLELCTLHLRASLCVEEATPFLLFGDGCSAALISAKQEGLKIDGFQTAHLPSTETKMRWNITDQGFSMTLSSRIPELIRRGLPELRSRLLGEGEDEALQNFAIHPGGRAILDAVEEGLNLAPKDLRFSRAILRDFGNMSSASLMFVLNNILRSGVSGPGLAMAFGPGITMECMRFENIEKPEMEGK